MNTICDIVKMGSEMSRIMKKTPVVAQKACEDCQVGQWKFIGIQGEQYLHYCNNCEKNALFNDIYGLGI